MHGDNSLFTLQEDNCVPHRAKSIGTYLYHKNVNRVTWPAQSTDLNPIENLKGIMKTRLRNRSRHPSNPKELFSILSELWNTLPDSYLDNLVSTMLDLVKMVKKFKWDLKSTVNFSEKVNSIKFDTFLFDICLSHTNRTSFSRIMQGYCTCDKTACNIF